MAMNLLQLQKGLSLTDFFASFGTQPQCERVVKLALTTRFQAMYLLSQAKTACQAQRKVLWG
jgi:hypothetical protein